MAKVGKAPVCGGNIETDKISAAIMEIKNIVRVSKDLNYEVATITNQIKDNWVGEGRNEFEAQYNILIRKIEDFGDTLQEIHDALIQAKQEYDDADDGLRKSFVDATSTMQ